MQTIFVDCPNPSFLLHDKQVRLPARSMARYFRIIDVPELGTALELIEQKGQVADPLDPLGFLELPDAILMLPPVALLLLLQLVVDALDPRERADHIWRSTTRTGEADLELR